jgi:MinD-like ATPase involved in chromosome partitioning or flagellar assembly
MSAQFITFYGYKGGAGRSLLAANVAATLAISGKNVLLVDWDLEAPGIGDFLDLAGLSFTPERWRVSPGLFEVLANCADTSPDADLLEVIRKTLNANDGPSAINKVDFPHGFGPAAGSLGLLGPGQQQGQNFDFALSLMSADWNRFFDSHGPEFHHAFRSVMEELKYDFVIIDTRTGMNLSALVVLRNLSDKLFFVSTKTFQALEGIHRAWKLLDRNDIWGEKAETQIKSPQKHLVLARYGDSESSDGTNEYIETRFGALKAEFELPFLDLVGDREQLFVRHLAKMNYIFGSKPRENKLETLYRDTFWKICDTILPGTSTGTWRTDVASKIIRDYLEDDKIRPEVKEFQPAGSQTSQNSDPDLSLAWSASGDRWGNHLLDYLSGKVEKDDFQSDGIPWEVVATGWLRTANLVKRAAIRALVMRDISNPQSSKVKERLGRLSASLQEGLFLDLEGGPAYTPEEKKAGESDKGKGLEQRHEPKPEPDASEIQTKASRFYRDGKMLLEEDDPYAALQKFDDAIATINVALRGAHSMSPSSEERAVVTRTVYVLDKANTLCVVARWNEAIGLLLDATNTGDIPRRREKEKQDAVALFDLRVALLAAVNHKLATQRQPLDVQQAARFERAMEALRVDLAAEWLTIREVKGAECALADFDVLSLACNPPDPKLAAPLLAIRARAEEEIEKFRPKRDSVSAKLEDLSRCATSYAMLVRTSDSHEWFGRLDAKLSESQALVGKLLSQPEKDEGAADAVTALAGICSAVGRNMEALSLLQDALQLIGRRDNFGASRQRDRVLMTYGLVEGQLGRPDLARKTWNALRKKFNGVALPSDSDRARDLMKLNWWPSASLLEMGDFESAFKEAKEHEITLQAFEKHPASSAAVRSDATLQLRGLSGFLSVLVSERGEALSAEHYLDLWRQSIYCDFYTDIDATRRNARLEYVIADNALRNRNFDAALAALSRGKSVNELGARRFGSSYSFTQDQLLVLEQEAEVFRSGRCNRAVIDEVLVRRREGGRLMLKAAQSDGWYYRDLMMTSLFLARISAILLRAGHDDASLVAEEAVGRWLDWMPRNRRGTDTEWSWLDALATVPKVLAGAVLTKAATSKWPQSRISEYTGAIKQLSGADLLRYSNILSYCGMG